MSGRSLISCRAAVRSGDLVGLGVDVGARGRRGVVVVTASRCRRRRCPGGWCGGNRAGSCRPPRSPVAGLARGWPATYSRWTKPPITMSNASASTVPTVRRIVDSLGHLPYRCRACQAATVRANQRPIRRPQRTSAPPPRPHTPSRSIAPTRWCRIPRALRGSTTFARTTFQGRERATTGSGSSTPPRCSAMAGIDSGRSAGTVPRCG